MSNKCNCDLCKRNKKFEEVLGDAGYFMTEDHKKWLEKLYNYLLDIEESYDILKQLYKILSGKTGYKAYLDGNIERIKK